MSVAFDNVTTALQNVTTNTVTKSHTTTGSNLALVVFVVLTGTAQSVSTITYAGTNLTLIQADNFSTTLRVESWGLVNPASGANNFIVTLSAANSGWDAIAESFTGVNQTGGSTTFNGYQTFASDTQYSTVTVTVTTGQAGSLVVDCSASFQDNGTTSGAGQTQKWQDNSGITNTQGSYKAGAASVDMSESWDQPSGAYSHCLIGFNISQAGGSTYTLTATVGAFTETGNAATLTQTLRSYQFVNKQKIPATANTYSAANPLSANVTVDAGSKLLVVGLMYSGGTARGGGAPTYNSVSLTQAGAQHKGVTSAECSVELWYLINPGTGSAYSLSIPNSGTLNMEAFVSWYKPPTGKTAAYDTAHGLDGTTSTNPTDSITTGANYCLIVSVVGDGAQTWTNLTGQSGTALYNEDPGAWGGGAQYTLDAGTAGAKSYSWTFGTSEDWGVQAASFKPGVALYTLTADLATFAETGVAAALTATRKMAATVATFTETGIATGLKRGYPLTATVGVFTETGVAAGLKTARNMPAAQTTFTESGIAAGLRAARILPAIVGAYTLTGNNATLSKSAVGYTLLAVTEAFTETGVAVGLKADRRMASALATFTETGNAANLFLSYRVAAQTGVFTETGISSILACARKMTASVVAFNETAQSAPLTIARRLAATIGSFSLTGNAATLTWVTPNPQMYAQPGAFVLGVPDAILAAARDIYPDTGVYRVGDSTAILRWRQTPTHRIHKQTGTIPITYTFTNNPSYWIGKLYDWTYRYSTTTGFSNRQIVTPPRTDNFREVQAWERKISKNLNTFAAPAKGVVKNPIDDPAYWIGRRSEWQSDNLQGLM